MDANPPRNLFPELSHAIIGCAMRVHSALGPGLLESVYEECLCFELLDSGLGVVRQVAVPLVYRKRELHRSYRVDLLVEGKVVVEVKAVDQLSGLHESQLCTYLKLSGIPLGLLINFNVAHLRDGIRRRIWTMESRAPHGP